MVDFYFYSEFFILLIFLCGYSISLVKIEIVIGFTFAHDLVEVSMTFNNEKLRYDEIPFNVNKLSDGIVGDLAGFVFFAQSSITPQRNYLEADIHPHLVSGRKTMILFKSEKNIADSTPVKLSVMNENNKLIATYTMQQPDQLTRPAELNNIIYGKGFWSVILPARFIIPGIKLCFECEGRKGTLDNINIGAPSELIIHTIDLGMLTPWRGEFVFQQEREYHRQYFHQIPVSKLIVSRYEPCYFSEIMLPDGVLLTDYDPSEGGVYNGTMRQRIGKELISLGINNANYGINSSSGEGEDDHPYSSAQLTAHNSTGKYANGIHVHGLSGGGGIVTLEDSIGNEFSHEIGHNYGLGHYVGGFFGSVHNSPDYVNSCWGWDSDKNFFIPNFAKQITSEKTCLDGICAEPFEGHSFGKDAMADGEPLYKNSNVFTLYTPFSMNQIQFFLESKAVFDPASPTGFNKWNKENKKMEPWENRVSSGPGTGNIIKIPCKQRVPVVTLVGYYDPKNILNSYIYPALHGSFGVVYPSEKIQSNGCYIEIETVQNGKMYFNLANERMNNTCMNKFHINIEANLTPVKSSIFVNGKLIASSDISASVGRDSYTVNGVEFYNGYPLTLLNPSAEEGDLTGWSLDQGEFRVITEQDDIKAIDGKYFFTARSGGNFSNNIDQISQVIALERDVVKLGKTVATLKFKSNGWDDGDCGEVTLIARDIQGDEIARSAVLSVHKKRQWIDNSVLLALPVNSDTLLIQVKAVREVGTFSDVHFDDFSLKVERILPAELQNPSAETGDLDGWDLDQGQFRVVTEQDAIRAADGDYYFTARSEGNFSNNIDQISQEIALDTRMVASGKTTATLTFKSNGWGDGDYGEVTLVARDAKGYETGKSTVISVHKKRQWVDNSVSLALPVKSNTLLIQVKAVKKMATVSDVHFDDFSLAVERILPTALQNPSAETGDLGGWDLDRGQFRVVSEQDGIRAVDGNYYFTARREGSFSGKIDQISQEIALNTQVVASGKATATLTFKSNGWGDGDEGEVTLIARDTRSYEVARSGIISEHKYSEWVDNSVSLVLPASAVSLLIQVKAVKKSGASSDVHFDQFELDIK